ncbi:glycosyltransferase [Pyrococcus sp.]|uniref:glycosyltransferase n=1 Tax=Pyrococcus sp. TaxID=33866 RepID=UPI002584C9E0|nr:glycosyltransferase [Pyrococcus sp.]
MRILLVGHYPPHKGGVARHVKQLKECLEKRHEVYVLTYGTVAVEKENVYAVKVPNIFGIRGTSFALLASKKIVKLHEKYHFDLIHAHYVGTTSFAGVLAKRKTGVPLVITAHGSDLEFMSRLPLGGYFVKKSLTEADHVIAVSHYLAKKALEIGAPRISVIPNWTELSGESEKKYILFLGRVASYKGIEDFIELAKRFPREEFVVAGDGPLLTKLKAKSPPNVKFLGYVPAEEVLKKARVLVLPSKREGFGLVVIEANSFKVPALGRNVGGIRELIRFSKNGYLFDDLEEAITYLEALLIPKVNVKLGSIGKRVSKKYSQEKMCKRVEKIYREVIS